MKPLSRRADAEYAVTANHQNGISNPKTKPNNPLTCDGLDAHSTPCDAAGHGDLPRLASRSIREVTTRNAVREYPPFNNKPMQENSEGRRLLLFTFHASHSGRQPQGESSGTNILEKSVPPSNEFLSRSFGRTAHSGNRFIALKAEFPYKIFRQF